MLGLMLAAVQWTPTAWSQSANTAPSEVPSKGLEEIVVTARKREEDVQTIPESVDVFSAPVLEAAHILRLDNLEGLVSNLNITTRADHTPDVVLRGVGAYGVTHGVGFYADDVQLFDGQTVQLDDLERIEVLKGPQGTLYGGSNIGGAIKYVSKLPTDQFEALTSFEAGNYGNKITSGYVSGPLVPGVLEGRISGFYSDTNGYIYDTWLNRMVNNGDEFSGRGILKYNAENTTVVFYLYGDRDRTGGENLYYRPNSARDYSYQVADGTLPQFGRTIYSATLNIQHQLGNDLQLTSISSYFNSIVNATTDVDKGPVPFLSNYAHSLQSVGSQELRLANTGNSPLKWLIGAFFQANDTPDNFSDSRAYNGDPGDMASWSNPALYSDQIVNPQQHHRDYALFGNVQYTRNRFTYEAGLRIDYNNSSMTDPVNNLGQGQSNTEVMPKVSLSYQINDVAMTYLTVARGFEPGDLTEGTNAQGAPALARYRPETALSYEAGVKSTLADRVRLNAALFYINYDNRLFQSNRLELGQFVNVISNIGSSENYGAEVDMSVQLTDDLRFATSLGVTQSVWGNVNYVDPDLNYSTVNLKGLTGPNTPAYLGSVTFDWSHHLTARSVVGARMDVIAIGRQYWDVTDHFYQPAYQLTNFGLRWQYENFELSAHLANALNVEYNTAYISAAEVGAPFNVAGIGQPRLWSVKAAYRF
jgi:iron complex outermembrane recepter protein